MPQIQMTPTVRIALYGLRIYLLVLMLLIGVKFIRVFAALPAGAPPAVGSPEAPAGTK